MRNVKMLLLASALLLGGTAATVILVDSDNLPDKKDIGLSQIKIKEQVKISVMGYDCDYQVMVIERPEEEVLTLSYAAELVPGNLSPVIPANKGPTRTRYRCI